MCGVGQQCRIEMSNVWVGVDVEDGRRHEALVPALGVGDELPHQKHFTVGAWLGAFANLKTPITVLLRANSSLL